jgi:hypothetical protein
MANLFKKSTKTLSFRTSIPTSFDPQTLKNIFNKYGISVKILSIHPQTCSASYIKPKDYVYLNLSQKQQLDYKLYSAIFEIYINQNPNYYLSPEYPSNDMPFNPYISDKNQNLKLQLLEVFHSIRQKYIEKK